MNVLLIVLAVVGVLVLLALVITGPAMKRRREAAHQRAIDLVGGSTELTAVGASAVITGSDGVDQKPTVGILALGSDRLAFTPWLGDDSLVVARGDVVSATAASEDLEDVPKAWIELAFADGADARSGRFRVEEPADWLAALS